MFHTSNFKEHYPQHQAVKAITKRLPPLLLEEGSDDWTSSLVESMTISETPVLYVFGNLQTDTDMSQGPTVITVLCK